MSSSSVSYEIHLFDTQIEDVQSLVRDLSGDYLWEATSHLELNSSCLCLATNPLPSLGLFSSTEKSPIHRYFTIESTNRYSTVSSNQILHGKVNVEDNLEDEWFAFWILLQVTKQIPNSVARIMDDNDGDFCLIEAAQVLPLWLEPDTSENRVWLFQGDLHILNLGTHAQTPTQRQAVDYIRLHPENSRVNDTLQREAFNRISNYPFLAHRNSKHCVKMKLPICIAQMLNQAPELAPLAAGAFKEIDEEETSGIFGEREVECMVRFTRHSYAMMSSRAVDINKALVAGFEQLLFRARLKEEEEFDKYRKVLESQGFFANTDDQNGMKRREEMARRKLRDNYQCPDRWIRVLLSKLSHEEDNQNRDVIFLLEKEDDDGWLDDIQDEDKKVEERFVQDAFPNMEQFMRRSGEAHVGAEGAIGGPISFDPDLFFDILAGRSDEDNDAVEEDEENETSKEEKAVFEEVEKMDDEVDILEQMLMSHAEAFGEVNPAQVFMSQVGVSIPQIKKF